MQTAEDYGLTSTERLAPHVYRNIVVHPVMLAQQHWLLTRPGSRSSTGTD